MTDLRRMLFPLHRAVALVSVLPSLLVTPRCSAQTAAPCGSDHWCLNIREIELSNKARGGDIESYKEEKDLGDKKKAVRTDFYPTKWGNQIYRFADIQLDSPLVAVNARLVERGLRAADPDSAKKGIPLHVHITELTFQFVKGGLFRFHMDVDWLLNDQVTDAEMWRHCSRDITSDLAREGQVGYMTNFSQALNKALDEAIADPEFQKAIARSSPIFSRTYSGWDVIPMKGPVTAPSKIGDVAKGVLIVTSSQGTCSGVAVSTDGYLLTSSSIVPEHADTVLVHTNGGATLKGHVVRSNDIAHLALVKVEEPFTNVLRMDTASETGLGDPIYAIGTPTDKELAWTITRGVLSGKRVHEGLPLLQTDARLSPGNKGGPFTDEQGAVIGVIVGKFVGRAIEGLGFAVPAGKLEELMRIRLAH